MADRVNVTKKLQAFLEELSPKARAMLVNSIEAAKSRGEDQPQYEMILSVVRPVLRKEGNTIPRRDLIMRAFYEPFSPFFYDNYGNRKFPGRISRNSLPRIWKWITRDVLPERIEEILDDFQSREVSVDDSEYELQQCADKLRDEAFPVIRGHLQQLRDVPRGFARLSVQLGNDRVLRDLEDLLAIEAHPELWNVLASLPDVITRADVEPGSDTLKRLRSFLRQYGADGFWLAAGIMDKLERPGLLVLIALGLAESDDGKTIAMSNYGVFVEAALNECDAIVSKFRHFLHSNEPDEKLIGCLKDYHSIQRKLVVHIEMETAPEWLSKLATVRRQLSDLIRPEIETAAGKVNRALRHSVGEGVHARFEDYAVADAQRAVRLLVETRRIIDSLALNELMVTTWSRVEQALEILTTKLLENLREVDGSEQDAIVAKLDAAIRFSEPIFGEDYAKSLRRSSSNALATVIQKRAGN